MNSQPPPRFAAALVDFLTPSDVALRGDLDESLSAGRTRLWYWRQVGGLLVQAPLREVLAHPLGSFRGLMIGWAVLGTVFGLLAGPSADALAGLISPGWRHAAAYSTGTWWPFQIAAAVVSYLGFALSALVLVRTTRRQAGPVLIVHITSVVVLMASLAAFVQWRSPVPTAIPHPLFYLVSVALPYHHRTGVVLVPVLMFLIGLGGARSSQRRTPATSS